MQLFEVTTSINLLIAAYDLKFDLLHQKGT